MSRKATMAARKGRKSFTGGGDESSVLDLVREGVRAFILQGAPLSELHRVVLKAAKKSKSYEHPLTGLVFRRIVEEAVRERKRRVRKSRASGPTRKS